MSEWKSPRKVELEIRAYQHKRFEAYMELRDMGVLTQALALQALREELEYTATVGETPTEALSLQALKDMLDEEYPNE